ncbi:MAG TPA: C1 family peptidase [Terriglobales bacterium]|nr:C1 family peptidase [Terriglobales bacterium]
MGIDIVVHLRNQFGVVRDQNPRPTCMAFAASDAHSFARGNLDPLSVEYAFYYAVQRTKERNPSKGVPFNVMSQAISIDGQPLECSWPYQNKPIAATSWQPPSGVGDLYRRDSKPLASSGIDSICNELDSGKPVIVIMDVSFSFFTVGPRTEVLQAPASEPRINTHAVIAVGYGNNGSARCILIRNSWGKKWFLAGYGWIDHRYLAPRIRLLGIME